jgi:hypothetical protein
LRRQRLKLRLLVPKRLRRFLLDEKLRFLGRNKANVLPSALTLLMEDTSSRARKFSRSLGFSSPMISIDW